MFATISSINLTIENQKYVIALGYELPDDKKIEEIEGTPQLGYTIQKEVEEGKFEPVPRPEDDNPEDIFYKLNTTANIYSKGFIDGVSYYNAVYSQKPANENKVILEK